MLLPCPKAVELVNLTFVDRHHSAAGEAGNVVGLFEYFRGWVYPVVGAIEASLDSCANVVVLDKPATAVDRKLVCPASPQVDTVRLAKFG